jgi:hypothetical protein
VASRFEDDRAWVGQLFGEVLVACPECGECARAESTGPVSARLSCPHCGRQLERSEGPVTVFGEAALDPYFELPLWLQVGCCGHTLWAYNREHLTFLEAFVGAKLRERLHDPKLGWANASLASRLPKWVKSARHRGEILAALETLAEKLPRP